MSIRPLLAPEAFVGLEGLSHLCTGGEAPWLKSHQAVYEEFARMKGAGAAGRAAIYERGERCRRRMGELWGVSPSRISFMPSAAEATSWLARGLDWRSNDNVVTTNLEFPSMAYAWRGARARGVEVRMVPHRNWVVREADLLAAVDARTRVLAVSQVSFYTGQCLDLERLAEGIRPTGALLAVDATHASGVLRVPAELTDMTTSSSYKWMLATHGLAPCYLSERAGGRVAPTAFGWRNLAVWPPQGAERAPDADVRPMPERLEPGNPAMLVAMFLDRGLELLLGIGIDRIERHARDLSEEVEAGLRGLGHRVISPAAREARSGNTCFLAENAPGVRVRLAERGLLCWGEFGRIRISTHLHNGSDDVVRLVRALKDLRLRS